MLSAEPDIYSSLDNGPQLDSSPISPPKIPTPVIPATAIEEEESKSVTEPSQAALEDDSPVSVRIPAALAGMRREQS